MMANDEYLKYFATHINKLREERNLSFQEMANACGMEKSQVFRICTKGIDLRISSITKISNGLKVSVAEIFNF